jgi:ribose transport system permease protein
MVVPPAEVRVNPPDPAHAADHGAETAAVGSAARRRALRWALWLVQLGPVVILAILVVAMGILSPYFFRSNNLTNLGFQTAVIAALAIGQLMVILTRGIDLSVGSTVALTGVLAAAVGATGWGAHLVPVLAVALAAGLGVGLVNGVVYVVGRVPHPFIVTLATLGAVRGLALIISGGETKTTIPAGVVTIGSGTVGIVPVSIIIVLGVALVAWVLLSRTQWGRWIYAIGGEPEAAKRAGLPVGRLLISVYALCGLLAGLAGIITAGRTSAGSPTAGNLLELDAITAVIVGGASFFGGRGTVVNALVGALILGVVRNGLDLLDVSAFYQQFAIGVIIIASVELDVARGYLEERLRALQGAPDE